MILPLGLSAAAQNAIFATANLFIQSGVNTFDAVIVEGTAAAANADSLVYDVMAAIYTACSSFMSQNYGAGKRKRMLHSYLVALGYSLGIGLIFGISLALFGRGFLRIFATDADGIEAGLVRLQLMGFCYGFSAFMDCTIAASRGLGKEYYPNDHCSSGLLCLPRSVGLHDSSPTSTRSCPSISSTSSHGRSPPSPRSSTSSTSTEALPSDWESEVVRGRFWGRGRFSERSASPPDPLSRRAAGV